MKSFSMTFQIKATEQYFPAVLFIMLYKVVLTFEAMDEILKCDHSTEYLFIFNAGPVLIAVFITEMVILHKYVYLLLLLLLTV